MYVDAVPVTVNVVIPLVVLLVQPPAGVICAHALPPISNKRLVKSVLSFFMVVYIKSSLGMNFKTAKIIEYC